MKTQWPIAWIARVAIRHWKYFLCNPRSQPPPEEDLLVVELKQAKRTDTPPHHRVHLHLARGDALRGVRGEVQGLAGRTAGGHTNCCSAAGEEEDGEKEEWWPHLTVSSLKIMSVELKCWL